MVIADDNTVTLHCVPGPLDLPALQYLTLSAPSVPVGDSITGTITLSGPAPAGGTFVTLTSVGGAAVVGSGVTVPEGSTSATFTVTSETQGSATVTATLAAVTLTAPLQVTTATEPGPLDLPALQYLTLSAPSVPVGDSITGTITLSGPAPAGGTFVTLTSVGGAAVVGSGVTVPEGSTSATFTVTSETQGSATVTATLAAVTLTAPLQVTDH